MTEKSKGLSARSMLQLSISVFDSLAPAMATSIGPTSPMNSNATANVFAPPAVGQDVDVGGEVGG